MSNVRRIFVEKKPDFAIQARELQSEIRSYLGIRSVTGVRVLIRYDVENISEETYQKAIATVFPSLRWMMYMRKHLRPVLPRYSAWNTCRDSMTSGRIPQSSA